MEQLARIAGAKLVTPGDEHSPDSGSADSGAPVLIAVTRKATEGSPRLVDATWADDRTVLLSFSQNKVDAPTSAPACAVVSVTEPAATRIQVEFDGQVTSEIAVPKND